MNLHDSGSPTPRHRGPAIALFIAAIFLPLSTGNWSAQADDRPFTSEQVEFFEKQVRPLLVEHCYECHATDAPKGSLRLDGRHHLLKGGDTGPAIVPGEPDESELIRAVRYDPDGYQMPPNGKLPQESIDTLIEWVAMGAPWPDVPVVESTAAPSTELFDLQKRAERWSFQPLVRPAIPPVQNNDWCRTPIDRFLLEKIEAHGATPAAEADRRTWLRRVSFDVIGLPPTPEEVEVFVNDASPDAYERVIDRLLASPHFGERWGRHWLDLVRYAESRGHEFDHDVANPWHYRDYVIRAINEDVPYDQFVVEHIAGDLLEPKPLSTASEPGRTVSGPSTQHSSEVKPLTDVRSSFPLRINPETGGNESILATGFWFLGEWVHSPVDIRQDEADRFENMIDVYSKTFLGLTVACARCHDHKFDPITTKDFYALQGYLQSSVYRQVPFETMEHNRRIAERLGRGHKAVHIDSSADPVASHDIDAASMIPIQSAEPPYLWRTLAIRPLTPVSADGARAIDSALVVLHGYEIDRDAPFPTVSEGAIAEPGAMSPFPPDVRLRTSTFEIESGKIHCLVRGAVDTYVAVDSHILINGPLHGSLVKKHGTPEGGGWRWISLDVSRYSGHRAHIEFAPRSGEDFAVAAIVQSADAPGAMLPALSAVDTSHDDLSDSSDQTAITAHPLVEATNESLLVRSSVAPAMLDGTGEDEYVFVRGNWKKRGEVVPRRFLEVFGGDEMPRPEYGSGRLELAEWMVDPQKTPILPRVIVNRIWQHYFGRGIVPTPDDFGYMGLSPSHPELLDWLACELVDSGWSLKHIHRLILSSAAYRMASEPRTSVSGPSNDPQLLSRMPVKRLEGEIIRDAMLALSGRLDDRQYGRSVPVHLTAFMEGRGRPAESGPIDGAGRRSLYIAVRRNFADPFFQAFDMPNPHTTIGLRTVSNVPAQALALMNNPLVIDQAGRWAEKLLREYPDADAPTLIRHAYQAAFSRAPTDDELEAAQEFLTLQSQELKLPADDPRVWTDLCHVLFNAKEFVFIR